MRPNPCVWVFLKGVSRAPGGLFTSRELGEVWIKKHKLTGMLSAFPIDEGCFDWAVRVGVVNMKPEKLAIKSGDPFFIGGFTTASQEHYHYKDGIEESLRDQQ